MNCASGQSPATRCVSITIRCGHCRWAVFSTIRNSRSHGCGSRCSIPCASRSGNGGRAARQPGPSYGASSSRMSPSPPQTHKPAAVIAAAGFTTNTTTRASGARTCARGRHGLPVLRHGKGEIASTCQGPRWPKMQGMRRADQGAAGHQAILLGPLPSSRPSWWRVITRTSRPRSTMPRRLGSFTVICCRGRISVCSS